MNFSCDFGSIMELVGKCLRFFENGKIWRFYRMRFALKLHLAMLKELCLADKRKYYLC